MSKILKVVEDLCKFSPRQGQNEVATANYLESYLKSSNINFQVQNFDTQVPLISQASLKLDNQDIPCLGASFESGPITSKSQVKISPYSDYIETISYTPKPSVCISRVYQGKLDKAREITGSITVEKYSYQSRNLLVGNLINPTKIIFVHYDGLGGGAIDNASGTSVCLDLVISNPELITTHLFVFAGNEELSYDLPEYWGRGYRRFEKEYSNLLSSCLEIIVVDGVGLTTPETITEELDNFIPFKNLDSLAPKIKVLSSLQSEVLKCYHCLEDTPDKLNISYLELSSLLLKSKLLN